MTDAEQKAWNEGYKHGLWQGQNCAQPATSGEPDMRHPKIQALIGGKARREIELRLVEQLLDDPDCDLSAMDMEYWHGLHDKLRDKLTVTAQPAPARVPLTNAEILALRVFSGKGPETYFDKIAFARAIEAAHGISPTKENPL